MPAPARKTTVPPLEVTAPLAVTVNTSEGLPLDPASSAILPLLVTLELTTNGLWAITLIAPLPLLIG